MVQLCGMLSAPLDGTIQRLWEWALAAAWEGAGKPGGWAKVVRTLREGHR